MSLYDYHEDEGGPGLYDDHADESPPDCLWCGEPMGLTLDRDMWICCNLTCQRGETVRTATVSFQAMTDAELLSAAIEKSGLSVRRFAREVLGREEPNKMRQVWRWLAGAHPLPIKVRELCEQLLEEP